MLLLPTYLVCTLISLERPEWYIKNVILSRHIHVGMSRMIAMQNELWEESFLIMLITSDLTWIQTSHGALNQLAIRQCHSQTYFKSPLIYVNSVMPCSLISEYIMSLKEKELYLVLLTASMCTFFRKWPIQHLQWLFIHDWPWNVQYKCVCIFLGTRRVLFWQELWLDQWWIFSPGRAWQSQRIQPCRLWQY